MVPTNFGPYHGFPTPRGLTTTPGTSLVSSTSTTDSLTGTSFDTELSSVLQGLGANSALDSYLGSWVSSSDIASYFGTESLGQVISATGLVVQSGEDPEAWVCISDGKTSSQTITDLESSSWVLLDDLACGLTDDASVPVQSVLVHQPDGSSDAVVYVSFADIQSTLSTLSLDHPLNTFCYADIPGTSSDLGLGYNSGLTTTLPENLSSNSHLDAYTETDPSAANDNSVFDTNFATNSNSDLLTSTSSSTSLDPTTNLMKTSSDSSLDVDVASSPNGLSAPEVSSCS